MFAHLSLFGRSWYVHTLIAGSALVIVGVQVVGLGVCGRAYGVFVMGDHDPLFERLARRLRLEHALLAALALVLSGVALGAYVLESWASQRLRHARRGAAGDRRDDARRRRDPGLLHRVPRLAARPAPKLTSLILPVESEAFRDRGPGRLAGCELEHVTRAAVPEGDPERPDAGHDPADLQLSVEEDGVDRKGHECCMDRPRVRDHETLAGPEALPAEQAARARPHARGDIAVLDHLAAALVGEGSRQAEAGPRRGWRRRRRGTGTGRRRARSEDRRGG